MAKQISLVILFLCVGAGTCFAQSRTVSSADARRICNRIAEIKTLPMKGDPDVPVDGTQHNKSLDRSGRSVNCKDEG